jgi:hypothetical protein
MTSWHSLLLKHFQNSLVGNGYDWTRPEIGGIHQKTDIGINNNNNRKLFKHVSTAHIVCRSVLIQGH